MPMGICGRCEKLVHIVPRGYTTHPVRIINGVAKQLVSDRQLAWFPVRHDGCDGHEQEIR